MSQPLHPGLIGQDAQKLSDGLHGKIIGQEQAVRDIVSVFQARLAGMFRPGRPTGNFLFLGPTGTGKTRTVEATAEVLVGSAAAINKVNCGEFQEKHEIARLLGPPPGYLGHGGAFGHEKTKPFIVQADLDKYFYVSSNNKRFKLGFVLFDEIEKANGAFWDLLLGVLDKAIMNLGDNTKLNFENCLIFMTSNLGAREMTGILSPNIGFAAARILVQGSQGKIDDNLVAKIKSTGVEAARRRFTPEFFNRLDRIVVFEPLSGEGLRDVLDLELRMLQEELINSPDGVPFVFSLTDQAKDFLLKEGTDIRYGARPLKRAIQKHLMEPLANLIATGQIYAGCLVMIDHKLEGDPLIFYKQADNVLIPAEYKIAKVSRVNPNLSYQINSGGAAAFARIFRKLLVYWVRWQEKKAGTGLERPTP